MTQDELPFGEAAEEDSWDEMAAAFAEGVSDLIEELEVDDGTAALMLLQLAIESRRLAYATSVEKPSGAGFRTDLDRMTRDFGELVREAKRHAAEDVPSLIAALAAAEVAAALEAGEEEGAPEGDGTEGGDPDWSGPDYDRPRREP